MHGKGTSFQARRVIRREDQPFGDRFVIESSSSIGILSNLMGSDRSLSRHWLRAAYIAELDYYSS